MHFPTLQNGLINHFNDSELFIFLANILFTIRFALILLHFKYRITIFTRQCGLKTLLLQGLSEPEFYGDLVYKFRKIIGKNDFPYHFKKIVVRYKKIGYNINVMRQTASLVVNPIKVKQLCLPL